LWIDATYGLRGIKLVISDAPLLLRWIIEACF
jgi:hypothetical protein